MKQKIFSMMILSCILSSALTRAYSETVFANDPIIITASRYETSVSKEGKDISVITEEEIRNSGKKTLAEILETVPGVTVTRKGADFGVSNVYLRGGKSGNVLIMIDGVRVSDPMGIEKIYDISGIQTFNIERIEIVKGAMSAMYGADASGGVINIITKKGAGRRISIAGEAGSNKTFSESVSVSDSTAQSSFFFTGSHFKTDGISSAKKNGSSPSDNDGYENITASGKMSSKITDNAAINLTLSYIDSKMKIDDGSFEDDPNHKYSSTIFTSRGEFVHSPFTWWNYKCALSYMSTVRDDVDPSDAVDTTENDSYRFNSKNTNFEFINNFKIAGFSHLTIGAEILKEEGSGESAFYDTWPAPGFVSQIMNEKSIVTKSLFLHDSVSILDTVFLNAGGRVYAFDRTVFNNSGDYNSTWDTSACIVIPVIKTKLSSSYGTGFRAPSLYELYSKYGNAALKPEKSSSADFGISQSLFDGAFSAGCIYFKQKYSNMIGFGTTSYENVDGNVRNRGVEVNSKIKPAEAVILTYAYTWVKYDETENNKPMLKRPEHKHAANLTVIPAKGLSINISYLYAGKRNDAYFDSVTFSTKNVILEPYQKVDMNIRYAFNEIFSFTLRGENLANTDYMETYGYNTRGRSIYGGIEAVL